MSDPSPAQALAELAALADKTADGFNALIDTADTADEFCAAVGVENVLDVAETLLMTGAGAVCIPMPDAYRRNTAARLDECIQLHDQGKLNRLHRLIRILRIVTEALAAVDSHIEWRDA